MRKWTLGLIALGALVWAPAALAATSPTVAPTAATAISEAEATLHGTVNPNGLATTYQFDWGPTDALGKVSPAVAASAGAGKTPVAEHTTIVGLSPDTTYYYTLVATNGDGTSTTPVETFKTTGNPPPGPTTGAAASVGRYQATLTGAINPSNQITYYYFQYGLTAAYGLQSAQETLPAGTATVPVSLLLPGIAPGVTFHYRLVAFHGSTSISYGADSSFETEPDPRPVTRFNYDVNPRKDAEVPSSFEISGNIGVPSGTPTTLACFGEVEVRFMTKKGHEVAASGITVLPNCTYSGVVKLPSAHFKGGPLTVSFRYGGDNYVAPSTLRHIGILAGKSPAKKR